MIFSFAAPVIPLSFFNLPVLTLSSLKLPLSQYHVTNTPKDNKMLDTNSQCKIQIS